MAKEEKKQTAREKKSAEKKKESITRVILYERNREKEREEKVGRKEGKRHPASFVPAGSGRANPLFVLERGERKQKERQKGKKKPLFLSKKKKKRSLTPLKDDEGPRKGKKKDLRKRGRSIE